MFSVYLATTVSSSGVALDMQPLAASGTNVFNNGYVLIVCAFVIIAAAVFVATLAGRGGKAEMLSVLVSVIIVAVILGVLHTYGVSNAQAAMVS